MKGYVDFVISTVLSAIQEAEKGKFYAQIGFGKGVCGKEKGMGGEQKKSR